MSYFVESLSRSGEWVRCRQVFTGGVEPIHRDPDIHSGKPTEFFDIYEAKAFLDWIYQQQLEGIDGVRIVEPIIGITGWKAVASIGRTAAGGKR